LLYLPVPLIIFSVLKGRLPTNISEQEAYRRKPQKYLGEEKKNRVKMTQNPYRFDAEEQTELFAQGKRIKGSR